MKKIIALVILCLLLCAASATAFAAKIEFYDASRRQVKSEEVSGDTYTLPEYEAICATLPDGKTFYGWQVSGKLGYLKPGAKISIKEDDIKKIYAHCVETNKSFYEVKYVSNKYNENEVTVYYPAIPNELIHTMYPYQYGFGTAGENVNHFSHWIVEEGEVKIFDNTVDPNAPEAGWLLLFPRAFADEYVTLTADDQIYVKSDLTLRAIWNDNTNPGGNSGNPGSNDGNPGGNNTNPDSNSGTAAASKAPKTGDESLPMGLLLGLMAVSLCGIAVMAKRRII